MSISELSAKTINLIKSTQVISSISSIIKELIENALDAGASTLSIKLENNGFDKIEIKDNGSGISDENINYVAKSHFTSKLQDFKDLDSLQSYGFRGEALSSMCAVSDLSIVTKQPHDAAGRLYKFNHEGDVMDQKPIAANNGTTITVINLFRKIPVRRQYYSNKKRQKDELHKIEAFIRAYAITHPNLHITFIHNKCVIFLKPSSSETKHAIQSVFTDIFPKFHHRLCDSDKLHMEIWLPKEYEVTLSSSSTDKLVIAVNRRPVSYKAIEKLIKGYYNQGVVSSHGRYPVGVILIEVSSNDIDVNLEPNKTRILFKDEDLVINELQSLLQEIYGETIPKMKPGAKMDDDENLPCTLVSRTQQSGNGYSQSQQLNNRKSDKILDSFESSSKRISTNREDTLDINYCPKDFADSTAFQKANIDDRTTPKCLDNSVTSTSYNSIFKNNHQHKSNAHESKSPEKHSIDDKLETQSCSINKENQNDFNIIRSLDCSKIVKEIDVAVQNLEESLSMKAPTTKPIDQEITEIKSNFELEIPRHFEKNDPSKILNSINLDKCNSNSSSDIVRNGTTHCLSKSNGLQTDFTKESAVPSHNNQCDKILDVESKHQSSPSLCSFSSTVLGDGPNSSNWSSGHVYTDGKNIQSVSLLGPPKVSSTPEFEKRKSESPTEAGPKKRRTQGPLKSLVQSYLASNSPRRRPMTAFSIFARTVRKEILEEIPGADFIVVAQELAKRWKNVDQETKKFYERKALETSGTPPRKTNIKDAGTPTIAEHFRKPWHKRSLLVQFDLENFRNGAKKNPKKRDPSQMRLIGYLKGVNGWIMRLGNQICALNVSRVNELVLMRTIVNSFAVPVLQLQEPIKINSDILGEVNWASLLSLESRFSPTAKEFIVTDRRIASNGFKVYLTDSSTKLDEQERGSRIESGYIKAMSDVSEEFGVHTLSQILNEMSHISNLSLRDSRPALLQDWFKSQAVRMARSSPHFTDRSVVKEKVRVFSETFGRVHLEDLLHATCLHRNAIFQSIATIEI